MIKKRIYIHFSSRVRFRGAWGTPWDTSGSTRGEYNTPGILRGTVEGLRAAGRDAEAQDISEGLRTARFVQMMAVGDPKLDVLKQTEATMPRYITVVQNFCKQRWPMRRVLLDHLGRASSKAGFKI